MQRGRGKAVQAGVQLVQRPWGGNEMGTRGPKESTGLMKGGREGAAGPPKYRSRHGEYPNAVGSQRKSLSRSCSPHSGSALMVWLLPPLALS